MSNVRDLIDRVHRDWLYGGQDQPLRAMLAADVSVNDDTVTLDLALLNPEQQDAIAIGSVMEVGSEQMLVVDPNLTTGVVQVRRGLNSTQREGHFAGALVELQPAYTRSAVRNAVYDNIVDLWPALYRVRTAKVTVATPFTAVPSDVHTPIRFRWIHEGLTPVEVTPEVWRDFPESSTKVAAFIPADVGTEGWFSYRTHFPRPHSEEQLLSTLGVEDAWGQIVVIGATAKVLAGAPDVDGLTAEYVTKQLEREAVPVGSAGRISDRLVRLRDYYLNEARRALQARDATPVIINPIGGH